MILNSQRTIDKQALISDDLRWRVSIISSQYRRFILIMSSLRMGLDYSDILGQHEALGTYSLVGC